MNNLSVNVVETLTVGNCEFVFLVASVADPWGRGKPFGGQTDKQVIKASLVLFRKQRLVHTLDRHQTTTPPGSGLLGSKHQNHLRPQFDSPK